MGGAIAQLPFGLAALKQGGQPADLLRKTKGTLFAA
jgi:hypothetical protein